MYAEAQIEPEMVTNLHLRRTIRRMLKSSLQNANCSKFKFFKAELVVDATALEDYYKIRAEGETPPTVSFGYLNILSS